MCAREALKDLVVGKIRQRKRVPEHKWTATFTAHLPKNTTEIIKLSHSLSIDRHKAHTLTAMPSGVLNTRNTLGNKQEAQ
jgi:hypothetical protein